MLLAAISGYILFGFETSDYLLAGGLALVLFIPAVRVPAPVKSVIGEVAAASIFIYLIHFQVRNVVTKSFGEQEPWVSLLGAVAAGIAFAYAYGYAQRRLSQTQVGRRFFGMLAG
jgi:hypothetical protein